MKESMKNRQAITESEKVGCYFCIEAFDSKEVTEFCDNGETGLCPKCGVDSLLPNQTDTKTLANLCEKWFTGVSKEDVQL